MDEWAKIFAARAGFGARGGSWFYPNDTVSAIYERRYGNEQAKYQTPTADPQLPVGTSCSDTLDIFRRFLAKHCPLLVYRFKAFVDNEKQMRMQGGVEDLVQAAFLCGAMYERTRAGMEKDRAGKRA